ncbi:MAG: aldehyde dehydrogenase family protein [Deltaproteobacteria bacterium]|nr:aldehyde dehydrogenase family protein [Deltaproteobacteria bacterium]
MFESLRVFYYSGQTRSESFRRNGLRGLRREIFHREDEILHALYQDLGKPGAEAYVSELGFVLSEIKYALRNLRGWMKNRRVGTPLMFWPARSFVMPVPKGVVLILGPWNYPFQLIMAPLIGGLSAGNCIVLKPSRFAPETAKIIEIIIKNVFHPDHCRVVPGHEETARELINMKWDHIFFTGSTVVGRQVMAKAAENLTPVTLELGGKNPCIVFRDADIGVSAERIAWGKFLNAGQTCIAPDTVYCHEDIQEDFFFALQRAIHRFFGKEPEKSPDYGRIVNAHHLKRLAAYLDDGGLVEMGGRFDEKNLYFAPTIIKDVPQGAAVLNEEIFGPILPVLSFKDTDDLITEFQKRPHPLALYLFTKNRVLQEKMMSALPSGTVGINETIKQAATSYLPFGGIGESGMGVYHGKASFDCFTQFRSVMSAGYRGARFHFPPYGKGLQALKRIYRFLY